MLKVSYLCISSEPFDPFVPSPFPDSLEPYAPSLLGLSPATSLLPPISDLVGTSLVLETVLGLIFS